MKHLISAFVLIIAVVPAAADDQVGPFQGEWRTTLSVVKLTQNGDEVTGTYGNAGQFSIKGTAKERELTFEFQEGKAKGDATFTLDDSGNAFTGSFQVRGGRSGNWNGWRPDPKATLGELQAARFAGLWLTDLGLMELKGFAGADRESPALVSEAMAELKTAYPIDHYLVGGHSQGGFLTYSLLMNYPESLAGAFPVSAGLIVQCEPDAYTDNPLRAAQRRVPLAIVHGTNDPLVAFSMGEYAAALFRESGWPAFRFFSDDQAAHMFARLPVGRAIRWLESLASRDPQALLDFAESRLKENGYRDAIAALGRARSLDLDPAQRLRADTLAAAIDSRAGDGAKALLAAIKENTDGTWVDDFLAS
jgi:predicted esterase